VSTPEEFNYNEYIDGRLTWKEITAAVRHAQAVHGLDVDGKFGPATRAKLLSNGDAAPKYICADCGKPGPEGHDYRHPFKALTVGAASAAAPAPAPPPVDRLKLAGERALERALGQWRQNIRDPKVADKSADANLNRSAIDQYIRSTVGAGWSWEKPYAGDDQKPPFQWCGCFAAYAWGEAITLAARQHFWTSTYRLDSWARGLEVLGHKPAPATSGQRLCLELDEHSTPDAVASFGGTGPRAGDILLVGDGQPRYGDHVTIVEHFDPARGGVFSTVEGNGGGVLPDGARGQGVVRAARPLGARPGTRYIARRLIRPTLSDLAVSPA
jgi:hypothetical protein